MRIQKTLRLQSKLAKELEEEAKSQFRTLTNYVEMLLSDHPNRKKRRERKTK